MEKCKPVIERAFELAASGEAKTITEIRNKMRREGYVLQIIESTMSGSSVRAQLRALMKARTSA